MLSNTQDRNDQEWRDDRNWYCGHLVYCARGDNRVVVPKWHRPETSSTLNFGRPISILAVALVLLPPIIIFAMVLPKAR